MRGLRSHLTYANVMVTLLAVRRLRRRSRLCRQHDVQLRHRQRGGEEADIGTAAVPVDEIGQGAVATAELKTQDGNDPRRDVSDNSLKGADIDESTLTNIGGGGPRAGT